jgi:hypothetical protein
MLKTNWPLFLCTLAVIATLIGCTWMLYRSIEDNASWVLRDLEQLQR